MLKAVIISKSSRRKQRSRLLLVLAISFVLIMIANVMDYGYILRTQNTVNSVYKDRVVAQDYIYQLSGLFYQKELSLGGNTVFFEPKNDSIASLMSRFGETKLTRSESGFYIDLRKNYAQLISLEEKLEQQTETTGKTRKHIQLELQEIRKNLDDLEGIQFTEGAQMTQRSNRALGMNTILSHVELVFLVIIGFIVMNMVLLGTNTLLKVK
ncbi:Tar ligand binding domain-containing protein [Allomuricauda sp. CAU 1633]|uniref:Tar ligand binding domain-containing protein n=1 Tax=Allomuricauda sp. CAU 1633 TaxID=2816036 RepID=UPI00293D22C7|nr:Tar ligand binding domain-containing protein [Muricauda sp. CAU 1633]